MKQSIRGVLYSYILLLNGDKKRSMVGAETN